MHSSWSVRLNGLTMVYWVEHRKGEKTITRVNYETGERQVVSEVKRRNVKPGDGGYWQRSISNGVPLHQVEAAKKLDAELGVPIDYDERGRACFKDRSEKRKWCEKHHVVDHDAGYRDFAPGDFGFQ